MDALWRTAMTGRARAGDVTLSLADHPATALVARVVTADCERQLLLAAGAAAIHRTAGRRLQSDAPAVEPAPAEQRPTASLRVGTLLQQLADANEKQLLLELASRLQSAGLLLPAEFLPTALDYSDKTLRHNLRPLLGERGRWLAKFRSEWRWATSDADTTAVEDVPRLCQHWTEGTHAERRAVLTLLHRVAPEEARRLLAEVWSTEKADARGELLAALGPNLSSSDEGILEGALDDRAAGVRQIAASLLVRIPQSQLSKRMAQRADAMLTGKLSGLIRKSLIVTCTPPQEVDASLERDGVAPKPPANVGLRAHALTKTFAAVRPMYWSHRFQAEPAAILAGIAKDEFADAAIAGWTDAAIAFADVDPASAAWLVPLGAHWEARFTTAGEDASRVALERVKGLLEKMPPGDAEDLLLRLLKSAGMRLNVVLATLLPLVPTPWSEPFARELLAATRYHVSKFDDDRLSPWINVLHIAADAVPDPLLTTELEVWKIREGETWQIRGAMKAAERLSQRVQLRRSFLTLLNT